MLNRVSREPAKANLLTNLISKAVLIGKVALEYESPLTGPVVRPRAPLLSFVLSQGPRHNPRLRWRPSVVCQYWWNGRHKMERLSYQSIFAHCALRGVDCDTDVGGFAATTIVQLSRKFANAIIVGDYESENSGLRTNHLLPQDVGLLLCLRKGVIHNYA